MATALLALRINTTVIIYENHGRKSKTQSEDIALSKLSCISGPVIPVGGTRCIVDCLNTEAKKTVAKSDKKQKMIKNQLNKHPIVWRF